jgi:uncharacterized Zn-binding protein involved in type VI secretion
MPAVCRIGDSWNCGDTQAEGSGTVFVNSIAVARLGDLTAGHCYTPVPIVEASGTVFADGIGVARIGDPHPGHTCVPIPATHGGNLSTGSGDVFADGA